MSKKFNLYLISDSTGETVSSVANAVVARFEELEAEKYVYTFVKTIENVREVIEVVRTKPGAVMYTIVDNEVRSILKEACLELMVPCIPVLSRAIADLSQYLNMQATTYAGSKYELDDNYYAKIEAINYAITHDDGQSTWDIEESDIIIIGASRSSKSPTCMYLAYKGYKVANIPFVIDCPLPSNLFELKKPLIIGLVISINRLSEIRKNRLIHLNENRDTNYTDIEYIKKEIDESKKLFVKNRWPIVDVTRRSVEEVAAIILQHYFNKHK